LKSSFLPKFKLTSEINKYFFSSVIWSLASTIISKLLVIIGTIVIARILKQSVYGELAIIKSNANLFISYTSLGLALTATKYIAKYRLIDKLKTSKIIGLLQTVNIIAVFLSSLILFFISDYLAESVLNISKLTLEIKLSILILIFSSLTALQLGIISGFQSFKEIAINTFISGVFGFIFQILFAYYFDLGGAVVGFSINLIILWISNYITIRKIVSNNYIKFLFSKSLLNESYILFKFSLPTFLIAITMETSRWFCNKEITSTKNGLNELAIFDVSYQWLVAISFIPGIISQVTLPLMSNNIDKKEIYSEIFYKNLKINTLISLIIFAIFYIFSTNILELYGSNYISSKEVFVNLIICSTIASINSSIWQITTSSGEMWINFYINSVWCTILILSCMIFHNFFKLDAKSLSISYLLAYLIQTLTLLGYFFIYQDKVRIKHIK
jgi:O-antigen/teichoic acid export membrane protein